METRNILDQSSNIIGTLTLPSGTAESIWTSLLGLYSSPVPLSTAINANIMAIVSKLSTASTGAIGNILSILT